MRAQWLIPRLGNEKDNPGISFEYVNAIKKKGDMSEGNRRQPEDASIP